jgi:type IV pilus assembly protein PilM
MSVWSRISQLVKDPPPDYVFEFSEAGIAFAHSGNGQKTGADTGFAPFEPGTLVSSPVEDNLRRPEAITSVLSRIAPPNGTKKRRPAAVILPDYAARVSVLEFVSFPSAPEEQLPLIRFRLKKTIPFDIDSAAVSYYIQPLGTGQKIEVVAVTVALEIIARYEALLRGANFHPGEVTTSALAALNLYHGPDRSDEVAIVAKLAGRALSLMVVAADSLKLFRCVELEAGGEEEILSVLQPTFAYVEDELGTPARRLVLCGFANGALAQLNRETDVLRSRLGSPGAFNAGLLGYLEGAEN